MKGWWTMGINWTEVNWKTTGYGAFYFLCSFFGKTYEPAQSLCELVDTLVVSFALMSAADASRVKNVVRAVDAILWKNQMDPETLQVDQSIGK